MADLTPIFNDLLKQHNAGPTASPTVTLQNIDSFLKEAYRIVRTPAFPLRRSISSFAVELHTVYKLDFELLTRMVVHRTPTSPL